MHLHADYEDIGRSDDGGSGCHWQCTTSVISEAYERIVKQRMKTGGRVPRLAVFLLPFSFSSVVHKPTKWALLWSWSYFI